MALALNPILIPLLVAIACSSASTWAFLLIGILWRIGYSHAVSRHLLARHGVRLRAWCWARPITELLDAVFIAVAFLTRSVTWREHTYDIDFRGRITRAERKAQTAPLVLGRAP